MSTTVVSSSAARQAGILARFADLKIIDIQSSVEAGPDGEAALWVWVILDDPPTSLLTPERLRPGCLVHASMVTVRSLLDKLL